MAAGYTIPQLGNRAATRRVLQSGGLEVVCTSQVINFGHLITTESGCLSHSKNTTSLHHLQKPAHHIYSGYHLCDASAL